MRKIWISIILLFILCAIPLTAFAADTLIPVGQVVGLQLQNGTVTVSELAEDSPAKAAGVQSGDCILRIDGKAVTCAQDIRSHLSSCGDTVTLELRRQDRVFQLQLTPQRTGGSPRLGVYLRDGVTGIGTITYYDPDTGVFGTLGHGVNDPGGSLVAMQSGLAYPARVQSVRKGKAGSPGQLVGAIRDADPLGQLFRNTSQGLFGKTSHTLPGQALPVASFQEVRPGKASILSTIEGASPQEYSVEILKIYAKDRRGGRNMLIKVTDPRLLEATGGIVQGMSGSPIIQNGKLIGAVTHVLVNDPTSGYGIFIENMLDAAA